MLNRIMTIVKSYRSVRHHPLVAIDPKVGDLLHHASRMAKEAKGTNSLDVYPSIRLLEAFCDVTNQRITLDTLSLPAIEEILQGFGAAMAGDYLADQSPGVAETRLRNLYEAWSFLPALIPGAHAVSWDKTLFAPRPEICVRLSAATDYQRWYWGGWCLEGGKEGNMYLRLAGLARLRGRDYVERIYHHLQRHARVDPGSARVEWNHLFDHLTRNHARWPEETLSTEEGVKAFMSEFTNAHFSRARKIGNDAGSQLKRWSRFVRSVEICLCKTGIWSQITSPIKTPPARTKRGSESKTSERENGLIVQDKMLTSIPLHASDAEAMELLFFQIRADLRVVSDWANAQADDLVAKFRNRKKLAEQGSIIEDYSGTAYKNYSIADLCATLDAPEANVSTKFLCKVYEYQTGQKVIFNDLAREFGFATTGSLFPHQCLLVLEHPIITTEFLRDFKLYNEHGHLTGFDEEARLITGYKNRKPSDVREQVVELSDSSFGRFREIIELTSNSRTLLRKNGDATYRNLFLTTGNGFSWPKQAKVTIWNDSKFANNAGLLSRLMAEFTPYWNQPENELVVFLKKVKLTNVRASKAVEVFIETKSTQAMSKTLGHEHYYADLLSHYLPEALLDFIKSRWIRIFQKSLVCLAMEDSPHLLRATKFHDIDELHIFLEKHRIHEPPPEAADPERKADQPKEETKEAALSISTGFLATILSLEAAVKGATHRHHVCGRAEYWSSVGEKIKVEIQKGRNRKLKKYLESALKLVNPTRMEKLIYVPSHWV